MLRGPKAGAGTRHPALYQNHRHTREGGYPEQINHPRVYPNWVPACAGTTGITETPEQLKNTA
ncbi:hypothetical protein POHY109586_23930 [Polaromonas hydrogenivorans]